MPRANRSYTNADIKHRDQNEALPEFLDFWKEGRGAAPKMLIFGSKFTTYKNINELDKSKEKIQFLNWDGMLLTDPETVGIKKF